MSVTGMRKPEEEPTLDQLQIKPGDTVTVDPAGNMKGTVRKIIGGVAWVTMEGTSFPSRTKEIYSLHKLNAVQ